MPRGNPPGTRPPNAGKGRKFGVPNKATANAREAISRFVDANSEKLQKWLDEIAKEDGAQAAFKCFMEVVEYHVPKLARTELVGKDGDEIVLRVIDLTGKKDADAGS